MSELLTLQDLANGHLDVKALGEAANGDENTIVTTRTGNTYPSAERAINIMFQNGGLPAEPFPTLAKMQTEGASLPDGQLAMVYNETANNGLYVKTAGAWVKSDYDPVGISKKYTENVFKNNNNSQTLRFSDFNNDGGFYASGSFNSIALNKWRHTKHIKVVAGDVINATYFVSTSGFAPILFFDNTKKFKSNLVVSTGGDSYKTTTATVPSDGYVVFQHNLLDYNVTTKDTEAMRFELISTGARYLDYDTISEAVSHTPAIKQKADLVKTSEYGDWSQGYVDGAGNETIDSKYLRTIVYKFPAGTQVTIKKPTGYAPQFGYATSSTPKVLHSVGQWFVESSITFTVTKEKPYVRFFLRNLGGDIALSNADVITITLESKVVYVDELADLTSTGNSVGLPPFESNFRDPSRATGGVMSIIDDDGGSLLYTGLYPFLNSNEVPFGAAIMGGTVGKTHEGRASVTLTQLKELYEDVVGFEIMSHSWTHGNQVSLPTAEKILQVERNKQWFIENGFNNVSGFVYPYGADDIESRNRVMKYYNAAYDYADGVILTPDNINNHLIKRYTFNGDVKGVQKIKNAIDGAVAVNGWIVITTHVGHPLYWFADSYDHMQEIIDYAKSKGMQFMLPKDGFQTYGNFMESSNGFRIQSNGKIVGAT